jgi:spermidine/putrescine-binding protein
MVGVSARLALRLTVVATLVASAGCSPDTNSPDTAESIVNFYNWFDYICPDTLREFARETGVKVNYDVYDSDETLEGKLLAVTPATTSSSLFNPIRAAARRRPLPRVDWSRLPNTRELDPHLVAKLGEVDPGNRFGVPHSWGTTGLSYDVNRILARMPDAPLDSWALIFDPDVVRNFQDCGVVLRDAPGDVIQSALIYLGRDPASESADDFAMRCPWLHGSDRTSATSTHRNSWTIWPTAKSAWHRPGRGRLFTRRTPAPGRESPLRDSKGGSAALVRSHGHPGQCSTHRQRISPHQLLVEPAGRGRLYECNLLSERSGIGLRRCRYRES